MPEGFAYIIRLLDDQKAAIERALGALREVDGGEAPAPAKKRGRPAKKDVPPAATKKRGMTPEGKERLVAALKARWAAKKAAAKKAARGAKKALKPATV